MSPQPPPSQFAQLLHTELTQGLGRLKFAPAIEAQFLSYLRSVQMRPAMCCLLIGMAMWWLYTGLDFWRMQMLGPGPQANTLLWQSFIPRLVVHLFLVWSLHMVMQPRARQRVYECSLAATMLMLCIVIATSSYALKNIGLRETSIVMVLMISVVFFPWGVRLRVMAPIGACVALCFTLTAPLMLQDTSNMSEHWIFSAVIWAAWVLTSLMTYYREKTFREQFLLRQLLNWEASHDPLTGLANRRRFHEHLATAMGQARRENSTLFLVILDIDHFKLYNDHYGHAAGDQVLRSFSQLLERYAPRPLDLAVRLGGEEFALIIYGMPSMVLNQHLQRLQADLLAQNLEHRTSPTASNVTVSIGAAAIYPDDTVDHAFKTADALLYEAKHQGRNRVCLQPA